MEMQPTDNNGGGRKVKRCRVCSDEAIGFNFNGLSCGSCKSFFRRNITKYESFVCSRNNDCVITLYSRKCCTRCRLTKCIEIGMRKDLISFREECPPEQMVVPTAANGSSSSSSSQQQHHFTANFNFNLEHILTYDDGSGGSNSYDYQSQQQQQQQQEFGSSPAVPVQR